MDPVLRGLSGADQAGHAPAIGPVPGHSLFADQDPRLQGNALLQMLRQNAPPGNVYSSTPTQVQPPWPQTSFREAPPPGFGPPPQYQQTSPTGQIFSAPQSPAPDHLAWNLHSLTTIPRPQPGGHAVAMPGERDLPGHLGEGVAPLPAGHRPQLQSLWSNEQERRDSSRAFLPPGAEVTSLEELLQAVHIQGGVCKEPQRPVAAPRREHDFNSTTMAPRLSQHRSSPAPGREGRWVDVMDRSHDGRKPRCDMAVLDRKLTQLAESLMPTDGEREMWISAFEEVRRVLLKRWPEGRVVLFGSAANGLSVRNNNDIDVCLQLDAVGSDVSAKAEVVGIAAALLEEAGMTEMLSLPKARVPVVKFMVPSTATKVDVTVNNTLACINTKLLKDYCALDARVAQLVALVKHWAKLRAVNDPYRGTLSSYCYVLMCIFHLQTRCPPILPVLQALPPTFSATVGPWTAAFFDDVEILKGFGAENKQSLADLVWEFFEYWAWKHDYAKGVVSVRIGAILSKDGKDWTRRIGNERHLLCVEDPFELSHDLGRTVDPQTRDVMRKEFLRAGTLLRDADDPMAQLFEKYKARGDRKM